MSHSFLAYIDESGDDGLTGRWRQAGKKGGSSHWLTISATVMRATADRDPIAWRDEILGVAKKNTKTLHFADLIHGQKVVAAQCLAKKPIRGMAILAHKPSLNADNFRQKNSLYFYLTRYLLERVSWICRDEQKAGEGDGRAKIVFSRRGGLSYEAFQDYLVTLKGMDTRIHWPCLDVAGIEAQDHSTSAALQVCDVIASSLGFGLEHDLYGNCEPRYAEIIRPILYTYKGAHLSYGVKIMPAIDTIPLDAGQMKFIGLFK